MNTDPKHWLKGSIFPLDPDPHQSEKQDPDADPQHCYCVPYSLTFCLSRVAHSGEQDGSVGQAAGVHGRGGAKGQGAQRDVYRDERQGGIQRQAALPSCRRSTSR